MSDRDAIRGKLSTLRTRFLEPVLEQGVSRLSGWGTFNGQDQEAEFENFLRGLQVIYLFSFLQANVEEDQWSKIRRSADPERVSLSSVNWDLFDIFKYIRDCFSHDWQGTLFQTSQRNTQVFHERMAEVQPDKIEVRNNRILLKAQAVHECLQLVDSVIKVARVRC